MKWKVPVWKTRCSEVGDHALLLFVSFCYFSSTFKHHRQRTIWDSTSGRWFGKVFRSLSSPANRVLALARISSSSWKRTQKGCTLILYSPFVSPATMTISVRPYTDPWNHTIFRFHRCCFVFFPAADGCTETINRWSSPSKSVLSTSLVYKQWAKLWPGRPLNESPVLGSEVVQQCW